MARPTASTLNYVAGQIVPNGTVVKLGTADAVDIYALDGWDAFVARMVNEGRLTKAWVGGSGWEVIRPI